MDKMLPLFVCGIAYFFHAMRSFKRVGACFAAAGRSGLGPSAYLTVTFG